MNTAGQTSQSVFGRALYGSVKSPWACKIAALRRCGASIKANTPTRQHKHQRIILRATDFRQMFQAMSADLPN
jgi:hypothetical protein